MRAFLGTFIELYAQHRFGARYLVRRPKDPVLVKQLLTNYTPERLADLARELLTTNEEWIAGTDRGIGILLVKASWLDGVLCERAARHPEQAKPAAYREYVPLWKREQAK